jgi:hypothetical protein
MKELFSGLALKQEEGNRRLREENLAIKKQMVELEKEKMQQNSRMEQLMTALLMQMGGGPAHSNATSQCRGDTRD